MKAIILFFSLMLTLACKPKNEETDVKEVSMSMELPNVKYENEADMESPLPPPPPPPQIRQNSQAPDDKATAIKERKIIKTGNISFQAEDLTSTRKSLDSLVKVSKGYISSEKQTKIDENLNINLTIRVPAEKFDELLSSIEGDVKDFDEKSINIEDVSSEYYDVEIRLKTKRNLENRYHELLKSAKKVSEMLEIEEQIGTLREEIESNEGRLKYLSDQVRYSTLEVNFYKKGSPKTKFKGELADSLVKGWENLIGFVMGILNYWPFILLLGIFIIRLIIRRKKRMRTAG